ncbi:hypothetical protein O181_125645 [Austropuccinia psidii MF-1]|uniref:Reverse transcriptase/retrotransposon-derived protein RNase H-like domain-containing protein n=1 Tax=Austropuccinia psidii MF-1 TaxID=1389203 RepID=A0A9Q3KQ20_9BASI|nr:hypothetical protein [Austropuccinia psidii MF-1]
MNNYSKKISSLTSFLKKNSCFPLNEEALSQFHKLKEAFTTAPILSPFTPSLPTIVETDDSDYALGAVLSQVSDSGKHPIAFDSHNHIPAELNYEIHEEELLAIVWALKRWRYFLLSLSSPLKFSPITLPCNTSYPQQFLLAMKTTATLLDALSGWHAVYLERGEDFISNNPINFYQLIKQDEVQPSKPFAVKVECFSHLIKSIHKNLWQDSQYISILQELGKGKSVEDFSLDSSTQLLLFEYWVVVPNDPTIQLSILQKWNDSPLAGHPGQRKTVKPVVAFHTFLPVSRNCLKINSWKIKIKNE